MDNRPDIICIFVCCCDLHFASSFPSPLFVKFGELGGFTAIQAKLNTEEIEISVSTAPCTFIYKWSGISWSEEIVPVLMIDGERCLYRQKVTMFTLMTLSCRE